MTNSQSLSSQPAALNQLIHELVAGTMRRHTFTLRELELLLDLENSGLRKSARGSMLKRYQRAVERQAASGSIEFLRLSSFIEGERRRRSPARAAAAQA